MPCNNSGGPDEKDYAREYMCSLWPILPQEIKDSIPNDNDPLGDLCLVCRTLSKEQILSVKNDYFEWAKSPLWYWYATHLAKDFQNEKSSAKEKAFAERELQRIGFKLIPYIKPIGFRVGSFTVMEL